jgi:hypothetical protein
LAEFWRNNDFEFSQKVNAQNGPATAACRKVDLKSLPWNCTVFLNKTPEEMVGHLPR